MSEGNSFAGMLRNFCTDMTEHEIELKVERMVDRLDARFMRGDMTQAEYDAKMREINQWAEEEYARGE